MPYLHGRAQGLAQLRDPLSHTQTPEAVDLWDILCRVELDGSQGQQITYRLVHEASDGDGTLKRTPLEAQTRALARETMAVRRWEGARAGRSVRGRLRKER